VRGSGCPVAPQCRTRLEPHETSHRCNNGGTLSRYATLLNLKVEQVINMLPQRFDGTVLQLDRDLLEKLDPISGFGRATLPLNSGWMHLKAMTRACQQCLAERPMHWQLKWQLPWLLYCPRHQCPILAADHDVTVSPPPEEGVLRSQQELLALAYGEVVPADRHAHNIFTDLRIAAILTDYQFAAAWPATSAPNLRVQQALLAACVASLRHAADGPLPVHHKMLAYGGQRDRAINIFLKHDARDESGLYGHLCTVLGSNIWTSQLAAHLTAPAPPLDSSWRSARVIKSHRRPPLPVWIPGLLPMQLFAGALSDLLYPKHIEDGREIAATACLLLATGLTTSEIVRRGRGIDRRALLGPALRDLQEEGRLDRFWQACASATTALHHQEVNYPAKRAAADSELFRRAAWEIISTESEDAHFRGWLARCWALEPLRALRSSEVPAWSLVKSRPVQEIEGTERLDRKYGSVLESAAEQALASIDSVGRAG
jgi:hypothetical protein